MKPTRHPLRRNAAVIAVASLVAALGIGGVVTAHAAQSSSNQGQSQVGDGDGEQNDATDNENDGGAKDDGTNQGPDANPDEPGHQDAE